MIYVIENAGAILLAALAGLIVGFGYHAIAGAGRRIDVVLVVTTLIAETIFAAILAGALILAPAKADPWIIAVMTAIVIWIGFVAPSVVVTLRYHGIAARAAALDAGHWLAVMIAEVFVLHAVGLVPPTI